MIDLNQVYEEIEELKIISTEPSVDFKELFKNTLSICEKIHHHLNISDISTRLYYLNKALETICSTFTNNISHISQDSDLVNGFNQSINNITEAIASFDEVIDDKE